MNTGNNDTEFLQKFTNFPQKVALSYKYDYNTT